MFRTDGEGNAAGQFGERRLVCFAVGVVEVRAQWKRQFSGPSMALKRTTLISTNQIISMMIQEAEASPWLSPG